jgi:hypothetical protein
MQTIVQDMPNGEYHAHPAIGSSGLKLLKRSPLHYWSAYLDPDRERREATPAMIRGTAWHAAIFEPEKFAAEFAAKPDIGPTSTLAKLLGFLLDDPESFDATHVCIPDGIGKTTKEGKALLADLASEGKVGVEAENWEWLQENRANLVGRTLLPADTLSDVQCMADAARAHPAVRVMFSQPHCCEASLFWTDMATGVACKIRPDFHIEPGKSDLFQNGLIVDGKSLEDASPEGFGRAAWNWEMHFQAAFYTDGFMAAYGTSSPPAFMWLAQEVEHPYANRVYTCGPDLIEYGRKEYRRLLALLAKCQQSGQWPGYPTTVQTLELPVWAAKVVTEAVSA